MNNDSIYIKESKRYWENNWSNDIVRIIKQQGLTIKNVVKIAKTITSNKMIIEYVTRYAEINQRKNEFIANINHIRLYK